jgi:hypothetical protein
MAKYRAVARLKMGDGDGDFERGDEVGAKDVGGKDELERLVASGSVLSSADFALAFPGFDDEDSTENQPAGTPSNLEQVEGTAQESNAGLDAAKAEAELAAEKAKADAEAAAEQVKAEQKKATDAKK